MYISSEFVSISHDNQGAPVAIIQEINGNREIRVAISAVDASDIALHSFKFLQNMVQNLSFQLIDTLNLDPMLIRFRPNDEGLLISELILKRENESFIVSPRPGESILLSIIKELPISVDEKLYKLKQKEESLREKIRGKDTDVFGVVRL